MLYISYPIIDMNSVHLYLAFKKFNNQKIIHFISNQQNTALVFPVNLKKNNKVYPCIFFVNIMVNTIKLQ